MRRMLSLLREVAVRDFRVGLPVVGRGALLRWWMPSLLLVLLLVSLTPLARAQASLSGVVADSSGARIAAAAITVRSLDTGLERSLTTDATGRFRVPSLPVGRYQLQVARGGFATIVRTGIQLAVGQEAQV